MPRRVLHDEYFNKAKAEGYLARSAYKLIEIQESKKLLRKGDYVLDLGCAPGAWLQVASEIVGPTGRVLGLDLQTVSHSMPPNVRTIVGDVYKADPVSLLDTVGGRFNAVLSDMAPNTTGVNDHEMSMRLCDHVVSLLPKLIQPRGSFAIKVFEGGQYPRLLKDVAALFENSRGFKPKSSRDVSREIYVVAAGYKGPMTS
ncbi:MAG TPA: RlmE family RNA methyltransferase [Phycisphaerales bacterium]|nr:RlmE family RNA methyltransferase [Phycisphaerales bacterium]